MRLIKNISFFGSSEVKPGDKLYDEAFEIAQMVAQAGYVIVNGGGPGVMDASTHGAEAGGGDTIAVTFYAEKAPGFEGRYPKNITDKEIVTGNYIERMFKLLEHGDLCIFFKGGTGTFSEFATAWCLARLYYGVHKPFILYGEHWKKIIACFRKNMFVRENELKVFRIIEKEEQVLPAIEEFEKEFLKRL